MIILDYKTGFNLITWVLKNGERTFPGYGERERCEYRGMVRKMHWKKDQRMVRDMISRGKRLGP